jgi:methylglutaconyl-CoA hydratase
MSSSENGYVNSSVENGIATIEFFHPQRNSLPGAILDALAKAIEAAGNNDTVKLIVLRSGGERIFCSGASFDELAAITTEADGLRFFSGFARVINAMRRAPQFIIARIQGKCIGGGVGIAAAADYTIALDASDIKLSELAVGIGPFVVGPAVERKIGKAAFTQLAIDAASFRSAEWAFQKGLFAELHPDMTAVDAAVNKLVQTLSSSSPDAMREIKSITWKGTEHWDELLMERAAISGRLILSDYSKNFIRQFKSGKS